jgi:hypothetical protein
MTQRNWTIGFVLGVLMLISMACGFSVSTANIKDAQMARDEAGTQPTTVFASTDVFYCNADLQNAPEDTVVKAVWTAVDVEGNDPNTKIDETEITTGSGTVNFQLSNTNAWPVGKYKVELLINDELKETVEFQVQ